MAYKFQSGDAILSGGLLQEGDVEVESGFSFKMHESTILDTSRNLANVGTISGSGAIQGASVSVDGVVTAGGFTIGSAVINEAELETIDGVTAGTVAASKAVVVDSNKDASGFRNVTATGAFIIGSANLNEADMELIDGVTAGSAAASKVLTLNASQVLDGSSSMVVSASAISASTGQFNHLTVAANSLTIGSTTISETEMAALDGVTPGTVAASKAVIVDANKDADGFRNVSGSGLFEADWFQATRNVTAGAGGSGGAFILGNAYMDETDLEKLDDITNGTVAASKAVVVDSNKDASGFRNVTATGAVTAGTSFIIGSADLNEVDLEKLDGITNGTAAANKALVVDGNKDISSLRDISGRNATLSGLTDGNVTFAGSSGLLQDDDNFGYNDDGMGGGKMLQVRSKGPSGNNFTAIMAKTGSISVLNAAEDALLAYLGYDGTISGSNELHITGHAKFQDNIYASGSLDLKGNFDLNGTLTAANLGNATVDLTADLMVIDDGAAGAIKTTSLANYATALAAGSNEGLSSTAGRLALDLNDLSAATVNVANDSIAIIDADGSNGSKKESIADLVDAVAGAGLGSSSGVLSLDIDELSALGSAALHQTQDHFVFSDNGTEKKITFSNLQDAVFADVSGDATVAAGGALTIAAGAVEHGMLNDNIISGQDELAHADIADADELMISDAGTVKRVGVDSLRDHFFGVVSGDATVADGGALTIAADAVHGSMLNDDVISAQTELAADGLAAADELLISDGGTLKKIGVDNLFLDGPALLSEVAVAVDADYFLFLDGGASGDAKKESIADLVAAMAGSGLTASGGVLATQGSSVALKADGGTLAEGYNYFADISSDAGVTLPASPSVGDVVHVKAGAISGANVEITISRAGSQVIDNDLTAIYLESSYAAVSLVYVANNEWRII